MGKSLKGKELGQGIAQRKDGRYEARYTDRWGNRKTIYSKSLREIRKMYHTAIVENTKKTSIKRTITLDEWFKIFCNNFLNIIC